DLKSIQVDLAEMSLFRAKQCAYLACTSSETEPGMNIYSGLLFLGGHIADPKLARSLVEGTGRRQPAAPSAAARAPTVRDGCAAGPVRRGAIVSICSVALSPFR